MKTKNHIMRDIPEESACPDCRSCGGPTVVKSNKTTGQMFYVCIGFPPCGGTTPIKANSSDSSKLNKSASLKLKALFSKKKKMSNNCRNSYGVSVDDAGLMFLSRVHPYSD